MKLHPTLTPNSEGVELEIVFEEYYDGVEWDLSTFTAEDWNNVQEIHIDSRKYRHFIAWDDDDKSYALYRCKR